jgi:multidrug resistance protein
MHITPSEERATITEIKEGSGTNIEPTISSGPPAKKVTAALAFLPACIALIMTGFGIIIPIFPQRLESLGLGAETLALMEGGFGLGMFLFSTPMGTLADRIGRKPLVLLALAGFVITNLMLAFFNMPALFILARFIEGTLVAGLMPASMAMVGDAIPPERQGRWMGIMTTAQAAGIALGPGIGGILYKAWGFSMPFLLSAAIALVACLLALVMLPETLPAQVREQAEQRRASKRAGEKPRPAGGLSLLGLFWLFAPLLLLDFGLTFIYPFALPQYPFFFEKILHYDAAQYGLVISVYGLALAAFPLLLGRLSEILSRKLLVVVGCLLSATLNGAMLLLHQYPLLIAASLITGVGSALLMPALGTLYLGATTDQNRSQTMGLRTSALSLSMLLAPFAQAVASVWITPQITFAISASLSLVMTVFAFVTLKGSKSSASRGEDPALA